MYTQEQQEAFEEYQVRVNRHLFDYTKAVNERVEILSKRINIETKQIEFLHKRIDLLVFCFKIGFSVCLLALVLAIWLK